MSKSNQAVTSLVLELNNRFKTDFIDANKEGDIIMSTGFSVNSWNYGYYKF